MKIAGEKKRANAEWISALGGELGTAEQSAAYTDLGQFLRRQGYVFLTKRQATVPGLFGISSDQRVELAHEFAQDVLTKIFQNALYNEFRGEASFTTYLVIVLHNEIRSELRKKKWGSQTISLTQATGLSSAADGEEADGLELNIADESQLNLEAGQTLRTVAEQLQSCIEMLPERARLAYQLRALEGKSLPQILEETGISSNAAVSNLLSRTKNKLKTCLEEHGWYAEDVLPLFDEKDRGRK